jgi:ATP-dependent Clp protease ATP-binding subunit ClpA
MFERFTDRARKAMALANPEAWRLGHPYIGTEHILLGLVKERTGLGIQTIKSFGVELSVIQLEVEKIAKIGPGTETAGDLPQTPRAKKVIEFAIQESAGLYHDHIGTEHLLLGLLREKEGVAYAALSQLGLSYDQARAWIIKSIATGGLDMATKQEDTKTAALRALLAEHRTEHVQSNDGGAFDVRLIKSGARIIYRLATRSDLSVDDLESSANNQAAKALRLAADELEKKAAELRESARKLETA